MEKAIVVVVSYNRRVLLEECINALRNQTRPLDAILVVNNGSTDSTEAWLKEQKDVTFITQNNIGSGGGFHTGIAWAVKNGYSWIWCMDDDGYPQPTAFENLMDAPLDRLHLRNSAVVNKEDKKSFVWKTGNYASIDAVDCNLIHGIGHPFNGTLLNRWIIERVGLPKKELFLWGDESEYYQRIISKNRIPVSTVASSIHYHPASAYSHKNDWDFASNWKMYFYIRNRFHTHKTQFGNKVLAIVNYCIFLFAFMGLIMLYQKTDKIKKLSFVFWPVKDALVNNFNHNPTSILQGLKAADRPLFDNYRKSIANQIRMAAMSISFFYNRRASVKSQLRA